MAYSTKSWGSGKTDTILAKYDKSSGMLVDYGYWGGEGVDEAMASLILNQDSIYMVGKTTSFGQTYDAVLIKISINNISQ